MDRLVSIDHLSGPRCAQARSRRWRERSTDREKESEKQRARVLCEHCGSWGWGVCKRLRADGQGKDQAQRVDSWICHPATIRMWSLGARKNRVECPQQFRPKLVVGIVVAKLHPKICPKNPSRNSIQKLRPKICPEKSVQKIRPKIRHFVCNCPDVLCQRQTNVEDIDIQPQRIHGPMAMPHEGCLHFYSCSREGQIETIIDKPKIPRPSVLRNASVSDLRLRFFTLKSRVHRSIHPLLHRDSVNLCGLCFHIASLVLQVCTKNNISQSDLSFSLLPAFLLGPYST